MAFFTAKDGSTHALDGREEAYESLTEDAFCKDAACNEVRCPSPGLPPVWA